MIKPATGELAAVAVCHDCHKPLAHTEQGWIAYTAVTRPDPKHKGAIIIVKLCRKCADKEAQTK